MNQSYNVVSTDKKTGRVIKQSAKVGGGVMSLEQVQAHLEHHYPEHTIEVTESPVDLTAQAAAIAKKTGQPGLAKALEENQTITPAREAVAATAPVAPIPSQQE